MGRCLWATGRGTTAGAAAQHGWKASERWGGEGRASLRESCSGESGGEVWVGRACSGGGDGRRSSSGGNGRRQAAGSCVAGMAVGYTAEPWVSGCTPGAQEEGKKKVTTTTPCVSDSRTQPHCSPTQPNRHFTLFPSREKRRAPQPKSVHLKGGGLPSSGEISPPSPPMRVRAMFPMARVGPSATRRPRLLVKSAGGGGARESGVPAMCCSQARRARQRERERERERSDHWTTLFLTHSVSQPGR